MDILRRCGSHHPELTVSTDRSVVGMTGRGCLGGRNVVEHGADV